MSISKLVQGNRGEDAAVSYLRRQGIQIIGRNFRIRGGEIDIIGIDRSSGIGKEVLVFYEVKTRSSEQFGTPFEAITYWKVKTLIKAAQFYILKHPNLPETLRIDAIAVTCDQAGEVINLDLVKNITG